MRIHGWCIDCKKVRLVQVTGSSMANAMAAGYMPTGHCGCRDERKEP